ncbi:MAG: pyridoxamine 5'-phosphate oxidase family protein [Coriobacteriales bacterium]|jgi:uncharacterized pyridoxamine 5'-phosphate oxidase family protein|nr:pyridoxamine 5'-phosphate oxidase family protein [Coriobacteriales bacterium]
MAAIDEVNDFLKAANIYYLATTDGDQPRVRAFGTVDKFEDKLYVQTGKVKDVYKQIMANPRVELCALAPDGGSWLRVACTLVDDPRVEASKHMLDAYPALRRMYDENDGNTTVLYMKDATATFSSFTAEPRTVTF